MNILVLDDEREIADLVEVYLKNENYNVFKFYDAKEAINCIESQKLDFAILDVMIKDVDGFKICKMIRDKGLNFPVIMLTAKIEDKDKIQGLTLGADDYITKPFNPLELIARVKSAYRRYTKYNEKSEENIIYINLGFFVFSFNFSLILLICTITVLLFSKYFSFHTFSNSSSELTTFPLFCAKYNNISNSIGVNSICVSYNLQICLS